MSPDKKHVIFLDELPWIETPKSDFVQKLAHFWNDYLSKEPHFLLVIYGPFSIDKQEFEKLLEKRQRCIEHTGTSKQVFLTCITKYGIAPNAYSREIVEAEVRLDDLF